MLSDERITSVPLSISGHNDDDFSPRPRVARGRFTKLSIEFKGETLCLGNGVGVIVRAIWYFHYDARTLNFSQQSLLYCINVSNIMLLDRLLVAEQKVPDRHLRIDSGRLGLADQENGKDFLNVNFHEHVNKIGDT